MARPVRGCAPPPGGAGLRSFRGREARRKTHELTQIINCKSRLNVSSKLQLVDGFELRYCVAHVAVRAGAKAAEAAEVTEVWW